VSSKHLTIISQFMKNQTMQIQRNKLPIAQYREEIIQILEENQILVLSGETGW
jgi:HrpA-like RNA helicase